MSSGTEKALWRELKKETRQGARYTRVETGRTVLGVSDVEYVDLPWHGWIEMKTAGRPRNLSKPYRLHHPYSLQQAAWLVQHQAPRVFLRSWLLVGVWGPRTWARFLLLSPSASMYLVASMERVSAQFLHNVDGVFACETMEEVVKCVTKRRME